MSPFKDKEKRKKDGLCSDCNQLSVNGSSRCLFHLDFQRRWQRQARKNPDVRNSKNMYDRGRQHKLKLENKCVKCGMPLDNESRMGVRCVNCYIKKQDNRRS